MKTLLQQGISEPVFYDHLVYKFKRIVGKPNFSDQFIKIIKRYKRVGYNMDNMPQSACLVVNPIMVDSYGILFNYMTVNMAELTPNSCPFFPGVGGAVEIGPARGCVPGPCFPIGPLT